MTSPEQYRALRESAGCVERTGQGQLILTGTDRRSFLQGLLTNDILALQPGSGCYAALLTANGRMIADMRVFELGDAILLDTGAGLTSALRDRFDQSIFSEDVQVEDVSAMRREIGVYGPIAAVVVARALEAVQGVSWDAARLDAMPRHANVRAGGVVVVRSEEVGVDGVELFVDAAEAGAVHASLQAAGAIDVDTDVAEITRIEAGHPRFGSDMDEDTIPLEAGIEDRAISLTKGCYVGQEIIIRVLHRGHGRVARRLVGLTFDRSGLPSAPGDAIRAGDRPIGAITSVALSPALGRPIAMGYVHRDFVEPGTPVMVVTAAGEAAATIASLPFVGRSVLSGS